MKATAQKMKDVIKELFADPKLNDEERLKAFIKRTGGDYATFDRLAARMRATQKPRIPINTIEDQEAALAREYELAAEEQEDNDQDDYISPTAKGGTKKEQNQQKPEGAESITTYAELHDLVSGFCTGEIPLLAIIGRPGLSKSFTIKAAVAMGANLDDACLYIKGRKTPIKFYQSLYQYVDKPVILDDCDNLMEDKLNREYVRALTESDEWRRIDWETNTEIAAPSHFYTKSPVCIIANAWDSKEKTYRALQSRAELIWFNPTWSEVYRECAKWFWDQEIFDYLHDRLDRLSAPDMRILEKAAKRKAFNKPRLPWQAIIDNHCWSKSSSAALMIELLADKSYKHDKDRLIVWGNKVGINGNPRPTWQRLKRDIDKYRPQEPIPRLILKHKFKPKQARPNDARFGDDDDEPTLPPIEKPTKKTPLDTFNEAMDKAMADPNAFKSKNDPPITFSTDED